jgi:prepilin-type N-terminal cleavage/methylation domain-containing protein
MQFFRRSQRAFTIIEMVVVLAITGIALALVGPSLILPPRTVDLGSIVSDARRAALRRSEPVLLTVSEKGEWKIDAATSGATIASGRGISVQPSEVRISISPLGLCTVDHASGTERIVVDPFHCTLSGSSAKSP